LSYSQLQRTVAITIDSARITLGGNNYRVKTWVVSGWHYSSLSIFHQVEQPVNKSFKCGWLLCARSCELWLLHNQSVGVNDDATSLLLCGKTSATLSMIDFLLGF
jgi:hypothetical protein